MKAIRFHQYGDADVLGLEDAPLPRIGDGELLIKVNSAGVNPADIQFRRGDYRDFVPLPLPFIPGWDVAGIVEAAGTDVGAFERGDAVFAMTDMSRDGAYAEYVAVRADQVARAPTSLPLEHAAGVPLAALTAWQALFDMADLRSGQSVLIHAGAGGVGLFAIQLARRAGAHVICTASATSHDLLRELGAHQVIDYRAGDFAAGLEHLDVVLDTVGGATRERSWPLLRAGGVLVAIAMPPPDEATAARHRVRAAMARVQPNGARLAQIGALIDAGALKLVIGREFPLAEAAAAHRHSETRHARGKIILRVA